MTVVYVFYVNFTDIRSHMKPMMELMKYNLKGQDFTKWIQKIYILI